MGVPLLRVPGIILDQRTTMASHDESPSFQSLAMQRAGRREPFVQRKARRRPYSRCPLESLMSGGVGNSRILRQNFSVLFLGGTKTTGRE